MLVHGAIVTVNSAAMALSENWWHCAETSLDRSAMGRSSLYSTMLPAVTLGWRMQEQAWWHWQVWLQAGKVTLCLLSTPFIDQVLKMWQAEVHIWCAGCLESGYDDINQLQTDPDLEFLRKDSRYSGLVQRFKLDAKKGFFTDFLKGFNL